MIREKNFEIKKKFIQLHIVIYVRAVAGHW